MRDHESVCSLCNKTIMICAFVYENSTQYIREDEYTRLTLRKKTARSVYEIAWICIPSNT